MYKCVIIDDDPIIRKGLSQTIKWENYGFKVFGEAGDGKSGVELIRKTNPDLIITDIQMPGLTGFEMLDEIKKTNAEAEIIIITAYRNFEYAKDALQHGVRDLLLKPTKIEEIINAVISVADLLRKREKQKEEQQKQKELFERNIPLLRNKIIHDLVFGLEIWDDTAREKFDFLNIHWSEYYLLMVRLQAGEPLSLSTYEEYLRLFGISTIMEESFKGHFSSVNIGTRAGQFSMIIGIEQGKKNSIKKIRDICEDAITTIRENFGIELIIALSGKHKEFNEMRNAYQEANVAAEQAFFIGPDIVIEYSNLNEYKPAGAESCRASDFDELLYAVRGGNTEQIKRREHGPGFLCSGADDVETVKGKYWDLLSRILAVKKSIPEESDDGRNRDILKTFASIYNAASIQELDNIIMAIALETAEQILHNQQQGIARIVDKAKKYIDEHYSEQFALGDVADNVYVSSSYLSRIFKRVTDLNFSEYVNKVRIEHARQLLQESDLMTYQIGEAVGYSDPHYFSRIFKKLTGHSPTWFRDEKEDRESVD